MEFGYFYGSICLVDAWQVDLRVEFNGWWLVWIIISAGDGKHIDSIVKIGIWRSNDCAIPVCETFVIAYEID